MCSLHQVHWKVLLTKIYLQVINAHLYIHLKDFCWYIYIYIYRVFHIHSVWNCCLTVDILTDICWHVDSPDLNAVDYAVRDTLQQLVCRRKVKDIDHLKHVLNSCCNWSVGALISGLSDFWSFGVNTLSINYINSVMFSYCKLHFCHALPSVCCLYWCLWSSSLTSCSLKSISCSIWQWPFSLVA